MPYLNELTVIGHIGGEPNVRGTSNGSTIATFSVATTEHWTDKTTGERRQATTWHNVVAWAKKAELAGKMLHKGDLVYVKGKLKKNKYTDSSGNERTTCQLQADTFLCLSRRGSGGGQDNAVDSPAPEPVDDADVPF